MSGTTLVSLPKADRVLGSTLDTTELAAARSSPVASQSGSISSLSKQPVGPTFDRPVLSPPDGHMSVLSYLREVAGFQNFGDKYLTAKSNALANTNKEIERLSAENMEKMRDAAGKASTSDVWSFLKKIATCILAAISVVIGISLIATGGGAIIGGAMIASGILSIANLVLSDAGFWEWVAKKLANDNEDKRKMIAMALPAVVGIASGAIGLFGSVGSLLWSSLNFMQQALVVAHAIFGVTDGVTTIGKGVADGQVLFAEADIVQSRLETAQVRFQSENISKAIEEVLNYLGSVQENALGMLKMIIQSNQRIVQG